MESRKLFTGSALRGAAARAAPRRSPSRSAPAPRPAIAVVPLGGNTGLTGAGVPQGGVVLSLERMNRLRRVDPVDATITVEAGMILQEVQDAADAAGMLFPLSYASRGSARIGGGISTNAGGIAVLAYGNARDLVLGLEVVLADGRVWNGLKALRKDNAGYDLKQLFIGSEGTLGIVTAAVLRLFPRPRSTGVAFVGLEFGPGRPGPVRGPADADGPRSDGLRVPPALRPRPRAAPRPGHRPAAGGRAWRLTR